MNLCLFSHTLTPTPTFAALWPPLRRRGNWLRIWGLWDLVPCGNRKGEVFDVYAKVHEFITNHSSTSLSAVRAAKLFRVDFNISASRSKRLIVLCISSKDCCSRETPYSVLATQ